MQTNGPMAGASKIHKIRDDVSQLAANSHRTGDHPELASSLGYFDKWGQYLLCLDAIKDSAATVSRDPSSQAARDELEWLMDAKPSVLSANRCFEVLGSLFRIDDTEHFQYAFLDALLRDPPAMHRALRDLYMAMEDGRVSDAESMPAEIIFDSHTVEVVRTSPLWGMVGQATDSMENAAMTDDNFGRQRG